MDESDRSAAVIPISRECARSRRKREVRKKTISTKRLTLRERRERQYVHLALVQSDPLDVERPRTRGECLEGPRPCPWVGCPHNLYLDVSARTGALVMNFPDLEADAMPPDGSCALDIADAGGATLERVGELMNFTRERTRQIEVKLYPKVAKHAEHLRGLEFERRTRSAAEINCGPSPLGGGSTNVGDGENEDAWRETGGAHRNLDENGEKLLRFYIAYDREAREAIARRTGGETPRADDQHGWASWTDDDQVDVDRWAVEVLGQLRGGHSLRAAMAHAQRVVDQLEPLVTDLPAEDPSDKGTSLDAIELKTRRAKSGFNYGKAVLAAVRRLEPVLASALTRELAAVMSQSQLYATVQRLVDGGELERVGDHIRLVRTRGISAVPAPGKEGIMTGIDQLRVLLAKQPMSSRDLVEKTGLARSLVSVTLNTLKKRGEVQAPADRGGPWVFTNGAGPKLLPPASTTNGHTNSKALTRASVPRHTAPPRGAIANGTGDVVAKLQDMRDELAANIKAEEKKIKQIDKAIEVLAS